MSHVTRMNEWCYTGSVARVARGWWGWIDLSFGRSLLKKSPIYTPPQVSFSKEPYKLLEGVGDDWDLSFLHACCTKALQTARSLLQKNHTNGRRMIIMNETSAFPVFVFNTSFWGGGDDFFWKHAHIYTHRRIHIHTHATPTLTHTLMHTCEEATPWSKEQHALSSITRRRYMPWTQFTYVDDKAHLEVASL